MTVDTHAPSGRIHFHEGSIILPASFEDRTTNIFVPADMTSNPNLSIARDWLVEGESLSTYIDRQLAQLKGRMPGHKLLSRQTEQLGQGDVLVGERIDASYKNNGRHVHQRQAAFLIAPLRALILTAASPKPFDDAFNALWREWLDGYRPAATDDLPQLAAD